MSEHDSAGFGKFVPGFDFLQALAKGAGQSIPQMPNLANWVAPTLSVQELEKRIEELKAVHFWLDQNSKALSATVQALEVQKMTLATLEGMNFDMGDIANAFKLKAEDSVVGGMQKAAQAAGGAAGAVSGARAGRGRKGEARPVGGVIDPLQWWGALTQQFQQIAADALKDVAGSSNAGDAKKAARKSPAAGKARRSAARKRSSGR